MVTGTCFQKLKSLLPFSIVAIFIILLISLTFSALWINFDFNILLNTISDPYIHNVLYFTIWQATLSTILSITLTIFIARALHRHTNFIGRKFLLRFMNLSFVLPVITLVLGIAIIHGKNGWVNNFISYMYDTSLDYYLYGMPGVLLGHLAFCLPLAVRIFLNRLDSIPNEMWKISAQLGFSSKDIFKIIELPFIKSSIIGVTTLIFMMCFTSFVIVLSLGGGPSATTIEVAIYHALKFDFDLTTAINLALIQFIICSILIAIIHKFNISFFPYTKNTSKINLRYDTSGIATIADSISILILLIISILPVVAIIISGFHSKFTNVIYDSEFWHATKTSLIIAFFSGFLTLLMALSLISGAFFFNYRLLNSKFSSYIIWLSNASLTIPAFVFITGLFIVIHNYISVINISFYLIIIMNAIAALPFAMSILLPASLRFTMQEIYLCQSLGINGWNFIKLVYWPSMRKILSYALALSITMSWGDFNIIALFGNNDLNTLPFFLFNLMSSYHIQEASVVALVILLLSFLLFWIIEEFIGGEKNAKY